MTASDPTHAPVLERLGLHRPELRAWVLYDWANSAFFTTIISAVFPIYYQQVAAADLPVDVATYRYGMATSLALLVVALLSPVLGALADSTGRKKTLLFSFQIVGVVATALMGLIGRGDWQLALGLFVVGNIGITGSLVFYDSLLPHIAREGELDRVSTAGYAVGYVGGGLLLVVNLLWILKPHTFGLADAGAASRASFVSVAVWWLVFSLPLYLRVPEPARRLEAGEAGQGIVRVAFGRLGGTFRELRRFRAAFFMMLAFFLYSDGINTIIRMGSLYGTQIGIATEHLMGALVLVQFVGVPCSFLFGALAGRIGARRAIFLSLVVYLIVTVVANRMTSALDFYVLAFLVGTVQGGSQALSRSLFASLIPRYKSAEFFGFFAVFEKFAGILGPAVFAQSVAATGSSRLAILSIALFFVGGGALLTRVDVAAGRRAAREAEEAASLATSSS